MVQVNYFPLDNSDLMWQNNEFVLNSQDELWVGGRSHTSYAADATQLTKRGLICSCFTRITRMLPDGSCKRARSTLCGSRGAGGTRVASGTRLAV